MPEFKKRQFLDFEKPVKDLYDQLEQLKSSSEKNKTDISAYVQVLEQK